MIMYFKIAAYRMLGIQPLSEFAYSFDCMFFSPICLTVKILRRVTMRGFLVGAKLPRPCSRSLPASMQATEPDKSAGEPTCTAESRPAGVRYMDVPHVKHTLNMPFFVNYSRCKRVQLRIPG